MAKTRLRAPRGTDEVNIGTERKRVSDDGTIEVESDQVAGLVGVGGFELADPPSIETAAGFVRVRHPDATCVSWGGAQYAPGEDGAFDVPADAVADLLSHGFEAV